MYKIGLVYNKPRELSKQEKKLDPRSYRQPEIIALAIEEALINKGHQVVMIPASLNLAQDITDAGNLDVIFNSCTGINSKKEQANIVGLLELVNIPFVGSDLTAQVTALHKGQANAAFEAAGLPITPFQIFNSPDEPINDNLSFPLFVKPESEGSALGVTKDSIVYDENQLKKQIDYVLDNFNQPALVEGYLPGREFSVGILGTEDPQALPITEITFPDEADIQIQTVDIKAKNIVNRICPAKLSPKLEKDISKYAVDAFNALNCSEYARVDVKLDAHDKPHIIELNTMPALEPVNDHFSYMAKAAGYSLGDLAEILVEEAMTSSTRVPVQ